MSSNSVIGEPSILCTGITKTMEPPACNIYFQLCRFNDFGLSYLDGRFGSPPRLHHHGPANQWTKNWSIFYVKLKQKINKCIALKCSKNQHNQHVTMTSQKMFIAHNLGLKFVLRRMRFRCVIKPGS